MTRIKSRIDAVDAKLLGVNNTVKFDGERVNNIQSWRGVQQHTRVERVQQHIRVKGVEQYS